MAIAIPVNNTSVISAELSKSLVGPLQERSTFLSLPGLTIIDTSAPLRVPVAASTAPSAAFVAPGVQIGDSSVAVTELPLLPTERTSLKTLTKVSNELVRQSALSLESVLQQRIVEDQALVADAALWNGAGTANSIKGILKVSGITTAVASTLLTDPDVLIDALAAMAEQYVTPSVLVMRPTTLAALRKIKTSTTDKRYVFDPSNAFAATGQSLFGISVVTTTNVPANAVAAVDTSRIIVGRDLDGSVTILTDTFGDFDTIALRAVSRMDVVLTTPKAVSLITTA